jgi:hypothetical protein
MKPTRRIRKTKKKTLKRKRTLKKELSGIGEFIARIGYIF